MMDEHFSINLTRFEGLPFDELTNENANGMRVFKEPQKDILIDGGNILGMNFDVKKKRKKMSMGIKWY